MERSTVIRPRIEVLEPAQLAQVHEASLRILSSAGVRVDSERARQVFAQAAAPSNADNRVRIPAELVEWALGVAPGKVEIHDRRGNSALSLGDGGTHFGVGVTNLYYQDPRTDEVVPFARRHMEETVRMGDALPAFDVISTIGVVQDVSPETSDLYATLEMVANTTKPLVLLVSDEGAFPAVLELLENLHGDLAARPFVIPYFNPVTPLIMNAGTTDKMFATIERGLPFIYSNYSMAGMSTPITPAGTLALLNAELLAGLVLSQLIREGTAVVLGMLPTFFDMKEMVSFYDPASITLNLACAEMMAHYQLPHAGTSGSGNGWGPDLPAAETLWMNHLTSCIGKVGLIPFIGGNLDSKAFSPTTVIYAHEVVVQALRFAQGFPLDETTLGLGEIEEVGPGGSFLMAPSTLQQYRSAYYDSPIFPHLSLEKWRSRGSPKAVDYLRDAAQRFIAELSAPEDHADLIARGEAFVDACAARRT